MFRYRIAGPAEYLAITGRGIEDIKITKKAVIWPFQKYIRFDVTPVTYRTEVDAMSKDKISFVISVVFTVGAQDGTNTGTEGGNNGTEGGNNGTGVGNNDGRRSDNDGRGSNNDGQGGNNDGRGGNSDAAGNTDALLRYAKFISANEKNKRLQQIKELVESIVEGETRSLAGSIMLESLFDDPKKLQTDILRNVLAEIQTFGLYIYNVNVNVKAHDFFSHTRQCTHMEAANTARINTAKAKAKGEVGAKQSEAEILRNAAIVDSEIRRMQLEAKKQEIKARTELKTLENENEARLLESVMALAEKTKNAQLAKVRARHEVEREEASARYALELQEADLEMKKKQKEAEADLEMKKKQKEAEADLKKQKEAEEDLKKQKEAEADLYKSCLAAQALEKSSAAEGLYLKTLMQELRGDYAAVRDYLMIKHNIFQEMAKVNAKAINGLQPKISIWSTKSGDNGDENASGMKDVASVFSTIPPLFKTVKEQTCMIPATWPGSSPD